MLTRTMERSIFLSRPIGVLTWILAVLCGCLGCHRGAPLPTQLGTDSTRIKDALQVDYAFSEGELLFAVCYDVKHTAQGTSGTGYDATKDKLEANAHRVSSDGFTLDLKYVNTQSSIQINGKQFPHSAGRIFHCTLEGGKVLVNQFQVAPELMKGNWRDTEQIAAALESVPELRKILK